MRVKFSFSINLILILSGIWLSPENAIASYCVPSNPACTNSTNILAVSIQNSSFNNVSGGCTSANGLAYTIYPPSQTTTAILQPGSTYQIGVTTDYAAIISLWIDYNANQLFDASEWTQVTINSTANVASYVSVFIPLSAVNGTTGMRIRCRLPGTINGASDACTAFGSGEAEDYTLTIGSTSPCVAPPTAGITLASSNLVCYADYVNFSLSGTSTGQGLTYQWMYSPNNLIWTTLGGATNTTFAQSIFSANYYRCAITCAGNTAYSTPVFINLKSINQCYCTSAATSSISSDIGRVVIGSMTNGVTNPVTNNSSANHTYSDFSAITPTNLDLGGNYQIAVSQISSNTSVSSYVIAYADWNHDGIFTSPDEYNYLGETFSFSGGETVISSITVPFNANLGNTRLRIILVEGGNALQAACGNYPNGETEDYTINIVSPVNCTNTPAAGNAISSVTAICGNAPFLLSLNNGTTNSTASFYWESSLDNVNWIIIPGSALAIFSTTQTQSTYYHCITTCGAYSATSSSVYVANTPLANCYCTSSASDTSGSDIGNVTIGSINNGMASPVLSNNNAHNGYTDFTSSVTAADFEIYGSYPIWVSQISKAATFTPAYIYVYIDYNQDGIFNGSEATYIGITSSGPSGNVLSSSIYIPSGTALGYTRMRIILSEGTTGSVCGIYGTGETEDYLINIVPNVPCNSAPTAGSTVSNLSSVCNNTPVILSLSGSSTGGGITYMWQYSSNNSNWYNYSNALSSTYSTFQYSPTYYRCMISCNGLTSYSTPVFVNQNPGTQCYCASAATANTFTDIGNVSINTLSNGSSIPVLSNPSALNSYSNFTSLSPTNLEQGGTYAISVSQISNTTVFYSAYVKAFIDFDQDGYFNSNESFYLGYTSYPLSTTLNSYIYIPQSAALGITRMRIILSESNMVSTACDPYNYGETEDYTINIIPASACPATLVGGIAYSSDASVCQGANFTLSLTGNSNTASTSYQWELSNDSLTWGTVVGANWYTLSTFLSASTYYRCALSCGGTTVYSTVVYVPISSYLNCYCSSYPVSAALVDIGNVQIAALNNGIAGSATNNVNSNGTYSDFKYLTPISIEKNVSYNLKVTAITSAATLATSYAYAYFDLNHDGYFMSGTESFYIGGTTTVVGGNIVAANITIPTSASFGPTLMRIVLNQGSSSFLPCGAYSNGETEDYLVNIVPTQPCTTAPTPGNVISADTLFCSGNPVTLALQNSSSGANITYQWQYSQDNQTWYSLSGSTYSTYATTFTQSVYYRCIVSCSAYSAISSVLYISSKPSTQCYCSSAASNTADDDIGNVTFINMNNGNPIPATSNPNSVNLYTNFTSIPAQSVVMGASYPISVTQINGASFYSCRICVFVDFNQNGLFDVASEKIDLGNTTNVLNGNTRTGQINVPFTAIPGITRMRIVLEEGSAAQANPCGTYTWGETEDYSIHILQNQSCASAPNAGNANSNYASVCQTAPFTLYLTGNSSALGQFYQWQYSGDGNSWFNLSSVSLDSSFTTTQNWATFYRCSTTCSSFTSYSTPVYVPILQSPICGYCTNIGGTSCPSNTKITNVTLSGTTLNNSDTLCHSINGSSVSVFPYGGTTTASLFVGNSYTLLITSTQNVSKSVWIDLNADGNFSSSEYIPVCNTSVSGVPDAAVITIPWGSTLGPTGLRVRTRINGTPNAAADACSFFGSGETEDYMVTIDLLNGEIKPQKEENYYLFPNPSSGIITLKSTQLPNENSRLILKNTIGELLYEAKLVGKETKIDLSGFLKGLYFLEIQSGNKITVKKIMKD